MPRAQVVEHVPYVMTDEYLNYVIQKYRIDFVVHGDDPCIVNGKDVYASAQALGTYLALPLPRTLTLTLSLSLTPTLPLTRP